MTPTDYVLDGQQRITVIYSCLGAPEDEEGFAAAYDLEKDGGFNRSVQHGRFSVLSGSEVRKWRGWVVQEDCLR